MISFLLCLAILIVGYFVYGKIVDNTFGPDDRETPAVRINDGVDYVVMPQWKLFLVQLLNIAGLGPIFGAMQGALWGPVVFLWITFGTIFAGGVHDYFSGMMSERNDGASIAEITGKYLGPVMQNVMRVFSVVPVSYTHLPKKSISEFIFVVKAEKSKKSAFGAKIHKLSLPNVYQTC